MTLDEACGIKDPDGYPWEERYGRYIACLGRENVRKHLPVKGDALAKAWLADRNLNNVPLRRWEAAAGFAGYRNGQPAPPKGSGPFVDLLLSKGITRFSMSDCVCILKHCAELEARDHLSALLAENRGAAGQDLEIWAVFQHCSARTDKANRYNIFDFDCAAAFLDEGSASRFEREDPGRRVKKRILLEGMPAARTAEEGGTDA